MALKIYNKRGKPNYKEKKLITQIEAALRKKYNEEELSQFNPASNLEELKQLHDEYCIEDVPFVETKDASAKKTETVVEAEDLDAKQNDSFVDPLNREEPIVRDYVLYERHKEGEEPRQERLSFDEPDTLSEEFELPPDNDISPVDGSGGDGKKPSAEPHQSQGMQGAQAKQPTSQMSSSSSSFGANSSQKLSEKNDRKRLERFAKYLVEATTVLLERGMAWYANKDINENKLAEYELTGELDLTILVTLERGQEVTIKNFFIVQCDNAKKLIKIKQEEKDDFTNALVEYLIEKNIKPTASQELILIGMKMIGEKVVHMITLKAQTNQLLNQLREMSSQGQAAPRREQPIAEAVVEQTKKEVEIEDEPNVSHELSVMKNEGEFDENQMLE